MTRTIVNQALNEGAGVMRLAPNWVPRTFCRPGRRLRLHPDDYFALGLERGGIDERWFSSTTPADNGPGTPENQGLSFVVTSDGKQARLLDAVSDFKGEIIGERLFQQYGRWPMYSKFFDNQGPLPHHVHHREEHARLVGEAGKPEMYFFPAQYNNYGAEYPFTFFGFNPGVTKEQVKECLKNFTKGDNRLTDLSRAYRIASDTGWDVPAGLLHAPASLCTYEPQFASDVYAMYQSVLYFDHVVSEDLLWKNCPPDKVGDYDYLVDVLDWDLNVDADFVQHRFMRPFPAMDPAVTLEEGYLSEHICYKCPTVGAKRLTILPKRNVLFKDSVAYGLICIQGHGSINGMELSSPNMIRFGQLTNDEFFVTEEASRQGVRLENHSSTEPLVILAHFAIPAGE